MIIGIGGSFFVGPAALKAGSLVFTGTIPIWGTELPAIATASVFGIVLNLVFEAFRK